MVERESLLEAGCRLNSPPHKIHGWRRRALRNGSIIPPLYRVENIRIQSDRERLLHRPIKFSNDGAAPVCYLRDVGEIDILILHLSEIHDISKTPRATSRT